MYVIPAIMFFAGTLPCVSAAGNARWHDDKYSMFIHFGLYSELGGIWDGRRVEDGYSEQIQSFAGIFSDWYADVASSFDPVRFNADSIVSLASEAGMRSVVFTAKHHDGFCMFGTSTTDFNSVDATPAGRDFVREMADACARAGLSFGIYYSLIDWHFPGAYPVSSHNADFIPADHHRFNMMQVRELLTGYGKISEMWFDMGSMTPEQSRELYSLVHSIQPECMVSGRIGNDVYDFAVMPDNSYPEGPLRSPWQSAASMFDETWGYRSWQIRDDAAGKTREKLDALLEVVSHGGNFLLNIGPAGDGSVVEFERDVLLGIGRWLDVNGESVYGTDPLFVSGKQDWGCITSRGNALYLILNGVCPEDGIISIPGFGDAEVESWSVLSGSMSAVECVSAESGELHVRTGNGAYTSVSDPVADVQVLKVLMDGMPCSVIPECTDNVLYAGNAVSDHAYSCFDYYSGYRSVTGFSWNAGKSCEDAAMAYSCSDIGRNIEMRCGSRTGTVYLDGSRCVDVGKGVSVSGMYLRGPYGSVFDGPSETMVPSSEELECSGKWFPFSGTETVKTGIMDNVLVCCTVSSPVAQPAVFDLRAGNGVEVSLNGKVVVKHLNPYRTVSREESVILDLEEGENVLVVRFYNRFEKSMPVCFGLSDRQKMFITDVPECFLPLSGEIRISDPLSGEYSDGQLHNLRILL